MIPLERAPQEEQNSANLISVAPCVMLCCVYLPSRVPLRHGARVLVDPGDQKTFDDVLSGKITEAPKSSEYKYRLTIINASLVIMLHHSALPKVFSSLPRPL